MHNRTFPINLHASPAAIRIRSLPEKISSDLARAYYTYAQRHRSLNPLDSAIDHVRKAAQRAAQLARGVGRDDLTARYVNIAHALVVEPPSDRDRMVPIISMLAAFAGAFNHNSSVLSFDGIGSASDTLWPELRAAMRATQGVIAPRPTDKAAADLATDLRQLADRVVQSRHKYTAYEWRLYGCGRLPNGWRPYDRGYQPWRWHEVGLTDREFESVYAPLRDVLRANGVLESNIDGSNVHGLAGTKCPHCTVMPTLGPHSNKARVVTAVAQFSIATAAILDLRDSLS
jgi:hypothetical protein